MPGLLELLSCLISSIFPGTVMNLVVHMLWSSPETWTSMHLVVWSLSSHSISSSFKETDFNRNLVHHNWLSYLTNLKTKYKKKKKTSKKTGMNHISLIHFLYSSIYSYPIRLLKYLAAFQQIWLVLKSKNTFYQLWSTESWAPKENNLNEQQISKLGELVKERKIWWWRCPTILPFVNTHCATCCIIFHMCVIHSVR